MKYLFVTTGDLSQLSSFVRLKALGQYLAKNRLEVCYVCDDSSYNYDLVNSLSYAKVSIISGAKSSLNFRVGQINERRKKIEEITPDVLHFLNPSPNNTASIFGIKETIIVSDWDELLSSRITKLSHRWANRLCESIARQQADLVTVSSRHLQQYFQEKFNRQSLYLPYATYLENIEVGPNPFERPTAVYMGNLHHDGDHDILIDAWTILTSQGEAPDLCMIGGGSCLETVKAVVEQRGLNQIKFLGYLPVQENQNYLHHAHVLLFPIRDTIGNRMRCPSKTFAYMQAGRPIVTCRVGEVAEALGDQGIYVEPTAEAFAQKVRDLFYQSLDNIPYDLDRHTWESRAKELMEAIETLEVKS